MFCKYFLSTIATMILLVSAQPALAGLMKYTYQTPIMSFARESSYEVGGVYGGYEFFFWGYEEQLTIDLIIPEPEFVLEEMESSFTYFTDVVVNVSAKNLFDTVTINSSYFELAAWKYEGEIFTSWILYLDVTESNFTKYGDRRASISINGEHSGMTLYQNNFYFRMCDGSYPPEWNMGCFAGVYNIMAEFYGEKTGEFLDEYPGGIKGLFGQRVPVPEPASPLLLLIGVAATFYARRKNNNSKSHWQSF